MTSSISFHKLLKEDIKKRIWLFGMCAGIFLVVLPIVTAMRIDNALYWSDTDPIFIKQWFMETELGSRLVGNLVTLGAIVGAITSSLYLHSRRQIDFYHSLPVKKEQWFIVAYVSSFLQVMVPCFLSYIIRYLIAAFKGVTSEESLEMLGVVIGISLICYHIVYLVSVIGMIVTGKMLTGVLMIVFLQLCYPFVLSLKNMALSTMFETYLPTDGMGGYESFVYCLKEYIEKASPVFLYSHMIEMYLKKDVLHHMVFTLVLVGIVLLAIALVLYQKRPTEAAGKAIAFPILEPVVKVIFSISVGIFFAIIVMGQYDVANRSMPAWVLLIGIGAAIFACGVVEFLYSFDFGMVWKKKKSFGIVVLGTMGICMILQFDLLGYDTYIPKQEELAAMSVNLVYDNSNIFQDALSRVEEDGKTRLNRLRTTEFSRIYKVAQNGISHVGESMEQWEETNHIPVEIAYYLKNGKAVYRKYYVNYEEVYRCMDALFANREYRENYFNLNSLREGKYEFESVNMYLGTHQKLSLSQKQSEKLLSTYIEELETKPFSVFENANLVAQFRFMKEDDFMEFPIYEEFTKTLALLKEEVESWRNLIPEDISSMTVDYTVEKGNETEVLQKSVKPEEMQQILDCMCYVQTGFLGNIAEEDVYVTIETNMGQVYNYFIRKGEVPEFLKFE